MIEEVSLITNGLRTQQAHHNEILHHYLKEQSDSMTCICAVAKSTHRTRQKVVEFKAVPSYRVSVPCDEGCTCSCHATQVYRSAPFLDYALGKLFIAYTGFPIGFARRCTLAPRVARYGCRAYVKYAFPSWFCAKSIAASFMASTLGEPSMSLAVRRTVPMTAELFQLANTDDGDGIRRLISSGMASPRDIQFETGRTALHVSLFIFMTAPKAGILLNLLQPSCLTRSYGKRRRIIYDTAHRFICHRPSTL